MRSNSDFQEKLVMNSSYNDINAPTKLLSTIMIRTIQAPSKLLPESFRSSGGAYAGTLVRRLRIYCGGPTYF